MSALAVFPAVFTGLYVAHVVGDHWVQTDREAAVKGRPGWDGRIAAATHVATLTGAMGAVLALLTWFLAFPLDSRRVVAGLAINVVTHWWADRRWTLRALAHWFRKDRFYDLGGPLGGAYVLDQSWHVAWLLVVALVIS